jgi:hypothetical protein
MSMRRILGFWLRGGRREMRPVEAWRLTAEQRRRLLGVLSDIGVGIVSEARGPVPLLSFGRRVLERLEGGRTADGVGGVPLPHFADALKRVIGEMADERLRVMSPTDFLGVGYVYNARDPETFPVRSSR